MTNPGPEPYQTNRVLITGGGGFVGFRLAKTLAQDGIDVVILDLAPPKETLPPGVHFFAGSVADANAVDAAICSSTQSLNGPIEPGGDCDAPHSTLRPVDAVFHVASYGMSGRELRNRALIEAVNVGGTRNVVEACLRRGVPRLVYISTVNTIWVGRPISGADEQLPYPPPTAYKDAYSATKARAERIVLEANGRPLATAAATTTATATTPSRAPGAAASAEGRDRAPGAAEVEGPGAGPPHHSRADAAGEPKADENNATSTATAGGAPWAGRLATCCIRSCGIWGPGETRHQPRVIRMVRAGLFTATFGDMNSLTDWIHVENLIQTLILAERALRVPQLAPASNPDSKSEGDYGGGGGDQASLRGGDSPVAAGQVYYTSDGAPINNFSHFKPFIIGLGYYFPSINVPYTLVYGVAALIEYTWPLLKYLVTDPPLTRMEVDKCCIEHWFDISKARRELGYVPAVYDRQEVVRHMAAEGWRRGASPTFLAAALQRGGGAMWALLWALVVLVLAMAVVIAGRYQ